MGKIATLDDKLLPSESTAHLFISLFFFRGGGEAKNKMGFRTVPRGRLPGKALEASLLNFTFLPPEFGATV